MKNTIKQIQQTDNIENMRFYITRALVESCGLILTDGKEPQEQLTKEQQKIKQKVAKYGYKVRLDTTQ